MSCLCFSRSWSSGVSSTITLPDFSRSSRCDFMNFVKKRNGQYVCAVTEGNKYKFRRALKFNEFEKKVMNFCFKRVSPFRVNALSVLKDSFLTEPFDLTLQEVTQSFFYNSQVKKQLNVTRVCENFQNKINSAHRKPKRWLVYESTTTLLENDGTVSSTVEGISQATKTPPPITPDSDSAAQRKLKPVAMTTMSPT